MAQLASPPDWSRLLAQEPSRLLRLLREPAGVEVQRIADRRRGYLHWEDFRRRPMPAGLSAEEGWAMVKMGRLGSQEALPFRTVDGDPMSVVVTNPLRAALRRIDLHEELKQAGLPESSADDARTFAFRAAIEEAFSSSRIEGADSTRQRARELIRRKEAPRDRGEQMILNNFAALSQLDDWIEQELTPELLLHIHEVVTRDACEDPDDVGRFRTDDEVRVRDRLTSEIVHVPPRAGEILDRVEQLCRFANEVREDEHYMHPIVLASLLHYQLAYDHPFGDGNGRTARWLFLWSLLRRPEYWWMRFLSVSRMIDRARNQYYRSFQYVASDDFDTTYFVRFQVRCVEIEMERFEHFLARRSRLRERARRTLRMDDQLNRRQLAVFDYVTRHRDAVFTQQGHEQYHDVSRMTARRDLQELVDLGLLDAARRGRVIHYTPTAKFRRMARAAARG